MELSDMKRVISWFIFTSVIFCLACAGDQTLKGIPGSEPAHKIVKMKVTGRIVDITATTLKLEHTVKEPTETLEFDLEIPITKFKIGDKVVVWYIIKNKKKVLKEIRPQRVFKEKKAPNIRHGEEEDYYG